MSLKIYIKRFDEGYVLCRYSSLTRGKAYAKGTMIHKLSQPFPTYGQAVTARQELEREEQRELFMVGHNE